MSPAVPAGWPGDGARLLEPSIGYALGVTRAVTPELLSRPTPCGDWDLRMLLCHACESLAAVGEGLATGCVSLYPDAADRDLAADPAGAFRDRACQLLTAWIRAGGQGQPVDIGGWQLGAGVLAAAGALEIAVHGWDISRACGQRRPIPPALAAGLVAIAPGLVPLAGRHPLFAAPVALAASAGPSDRLAAFLGRSPGLG